MAKAKRRTKAECEAVKKRATELFHERGPVSLRRVHYLLYSDPTVNQPNTQSAYDKLSEWVRDLRLDGTIPWHLVRDSLRGLRGARDWRDPSAWADEVKGQYRRGVWPDQPAYVEAWVEKDAAASVVWEACRPYRVDYNVGRGYDGWTSIKDAADRYRVYEASGRPVTVVYVGDFDPSGEDMHRSLVDRLARLGAYPDVPKVALTPEQARGLPPNFTKVTDSRRAEFVARHGDLAVELDAMDEGELKRLIAEAITASMDLDALEATLEVERRERRLIRETMEGLSL